MRGKVENTVEKHTDHRITPAYAGKSYAPAFSFPILEDHPRVCGEKTVFRTNGPTTEGSPPRMRGKEVDGFGFFCGLGITPAYAGKSVFLALRSAISWDHPRVCGEKRCYHFGYSIRRGSPPRVRGKVSECYESMSPDGITPACAGKSGTLRNNRRNGEDHPRVCGEKSWGTSGHS